jgi:hypothetical protein
MSATQERGDVEDHYKKQRRHDYHNQNLASDDPAEAAEILRALSEIDDLPIQPEDDPVMGQLISKLSSTANLSVESVRSNEWVREYILILWLSKKPKETGCHTDWRAWAHGSDDAAVEPLSSGKRLEVETLVTSSKLALSRSEDFRGPKEAMRTVSESIVSDQEESDTSGGILGRLT